EACLWVGGWDPTGDQETVAGQHRRMFNGLSESGFVVDQVVRRHHHQHGLGAMTGLCRKRGVGYGSGGVAAFRFKQEMGLVMPVHPCFGQLILAGEVMFAVGDRHYGAAARKQGGGTVVCLAQQGLAIGQAHEGLRMPFAGYRPEAGSGTTGKDHGNDRHRDYSLLTRRRSASTIMAMSSARLVLAVQPSLR